LSGTAPETRAQQSDTLQRARTLYRKAETAYEDEENEDAIDHLEQIEELLADRSSPTVDTLRARRLVLLSKAQYRVGELGGAQRAHIKMTKTGAVPAGLADEMADHRKRVEAALMEALPGAVRSSIRTAATMDTLDLSGRGLIGLPDSIGRLSPRKRVDLSYNDLPSLPKGIGRWTKVQELDVSDNRLGCVPESIGRLSRLEELDLSWNRLTELPASIGHLTNLRRLDLADNGIQELPSSVDQLTRLKKLDLSGNPNSLSRQARRLKDQLPNSTNIFYPTERWRQTVKVRFPVKSPTAGWNTTHRALLDTLANVLARRDTVMVRQSPDASEQPFSELKDRVVDSVSVGVYGRRHHTEATHVRVDYIFRITKSGGFEDEIQAIHFLHWSGPKQAFAPHLSLEAQQPWIQDVLENKGLDDGTCQVAPIPFRDTLTFPRLVGEGGDGTIVQISGHDVRDGYEQEKRQLIKKITRLTYETW
jgi:hypothetical protein